MRLSWASVIAGAHDEMELGMRVPRNLTFGGNGMLEKRNVSVENDKITPADRNALDNRNPATASAENEQSTAVTRIGLGSRRPSPIGDLASRPHRSRGLWTRSPTDG